MRMVGELYQKILDEFPEFDQVEFPEYQRADWPTRLTIARHSEKELRGQGETAEGAAAEALTIIEVVGEAEAWRDVVSKNMRV